MWLILPARLPIKGSRSVDLAGGLATVLIALVALALFGVLAWGVYQAIYAMLVWGPGKALVVMTGLAVLCLVFLCVDHYRQHRCRRYRR